MIFSSSIFLFKFLPIFFIIYFLLPNRTLKNYFSLGASLLFYAYGEPVFVLLMLASITINYIFGLLINNKKSKKKTLLIINVIINLSLFFIFKYLDFFITNVNLIFSTNLPLMHIPLPIGISFFTFQAMSYVFDVYREGDEMVQKNPFYLGLYISLFPQLIAGPIVRYKTIADDIEHRTHSMKLISDGISIFIVGLAKKVLISNNMAIVADYVFNAQTQSLDWKFALLGGVSYLLQIYFDFSGYSDMAIGLGYMMGFKFQTNFNYPLYANSVTDFWRKWHISLSSWFRDYVYIPLGGKYVSFKRSILNLLIIWLLTGIWHGASWTFIVWGMWHFTFIVIERIFKKLTNKSYEEVFPKIITKTTTFILMMLAFIWFRATTVTQGYEIIKAILTLQQSSIDPSLFYIKNFWLYYLFAFLYAFEILKNIANKIEEKSTKIFQILESIVLIAIFYICVISIVKGSYNPFIYFNF